VVCAPRYRTAAILAGLGKNHAAAGHLAARSLRDGAGSMAGTGVRGGATGGTGRIGEKGVEPPGPVFRLAGGGFGGIDGGSLSAGARPPARRIARGPHFPAGGGRGAFPVHATPPQSSVAHATTASTTDGDARAARKAPGGASTLAAVAAAEVVAAAAPHVGNGAGDGATTNQSSTPATARPATSSAAACAAARQAKCVQGLSGLCRPRRPRHGHVGDGFLRQFDDRRRSE